MFINKLTRGLLLVSVFYIVGLFAQSKAQDLTKECDLCLAEVLLPMHAETTMEDASKTQISALYMEAIYGRCITLQEFKKKMGCDEMALGYIEMMVEYIKDQTKMF